MRFLIEDIERKLDNLAQVLKSQRFDQITLSTISELKESLSTVKTPTVPTRILWDKYTSVLSLLEKIIRIASTPGNEYAVHDALRSLRAQLVEFKRILERAYLVERAQLILPSVLGLSYALTRYLSIESYNFIIISIGIVTIISAIYKPILGIALTGVLGASYVILEGDAGSILTGFLLIAISALFIYTYTFARSEAFLSKVRSAIGNINKVISSAFMPINIKLEELVDELIGKDYKIENTGVFKFLEHRELLRYKAITMIASGRSQYTLFISDSKK